MKEGWEIKKLGDVCEIITRGISPKYSETEGIPVLNQKCIRNHQINVALARLHNIEIKAVKEERFIKIGDVLINSTGTGTLGRVAQVRENLLATVDSHVTIVRPKKELFYNEFFGYALIRIEEEITKGGEGCGGQTELSKKKLKEEYRIHFPKSLSEQQRIVTILDEAFAAIAKAKANAEQNLKNAKELFENFLQNVFENKGEYWEEKRLGEIATFRNGMNFSKASRGERIKIVGVKDFQNAFFVPEESLDSVTIEGQLNENDVLKEGDILAVRSNGNPELIGRTILAGGLSENTSHSGFTIRIRLDSTVVSPFYLCNFLKTKRIRRKLIDGGNGINIKSLNQGTLSSLLITFPKSLTEQQAIVRKLNSMAVETKKLEAIYQKKIDDLEELKKSILQKVFSGELKTLEAVAV